MDATTTITINGTAGDAFLTSLARYGAPVPRALRWLATSVNGSIAVGPTDAQHVEHFVDALLASGWIAVDEPPLLFSPRVGDVVEMRRDVLVETARPSVGTPIVWRLVERGWHGRLIGFRDRANEEPRAVVELDDCVVLVRTRHVTRARRRPVTPL